MNRKMVTTRIPANDHERPFFGCESPLGVGVGGVAVAVAPEGGLEEERGSL